MRTLRDVEIGKSAVVARLNGEGPVKRRLMDMGLVKGTEVKVRKVAPIGDPIEMEAIRNVMGKHPAINSTKSQTGHMIGATGAAEIIYSSLMLEKGFISPSLNLDNPEPEFAWADLVRKYRPNVNLRHALSNSFAFGGSNAAVVISKI